MAKPWMKLDLDFWHSPEFMAIIRAKGEAWGFKVLKLYCLASEKFGRIDLADPIVRPWVECEMGLKGKRLDDFIDVCIDCEIFDRFMWETAGVVTNGRLARDGENRRAMSEKRSAAGRASGEARRKSRDEQR